VIAVSLEGWILTGFVVLALAAIAVSVAGWILLARDRRARREPSEATDEPQT
jgi:hypothetical protein